MLLSAQIPEYWSWVEVSSVYKHCSRAFLMAVFEVRLPKVHEKLKIIIVVFQPALLPYTKASAVGEEGRREGRTGIEKRRVGVMFSSKETTLGSDG